MPRVGTQPGRQVDREDRLRAFIHRAYGAGIGFTHLAGNTRTEQRIDQHAAQVRTGCPGRDLDAGCLGFSKGLGGIALQLLRIAHGQHPDLTTGTLRQRRNQIAIPGIVAPTSKHADLVCIRPAAP